MELELWKLEEELQQDPEYLEAEARLKPYLDLADEVIELRLERGWTQTELARRAGTQQANISRIENGLANPTVKLLHKLAEAFGTELRIRLCPPKRSQKYVVVQIPKYVDPEELWKTEGESRPIPQWSNLPEMPVDLPEKSTKRQAA
jgi:transcriptional regulator with XRE-family HTH domain